MVIDEAFRRFFSRGPHLSLVCDASLRVRAASDALALLAGKADGALEGAPLDGVLQPVDGQDVRFDRGPVTYAAALPSGEQVRVRASRDGELVHVAVERLGEPMPATLVAFGRELAAFYREEDIVAALARAVRRVVPAAWVCVRALEPRSHELTSLFADGPLLPGARRRVLLAASGAPFDPSFAGASDGLSIQLVAHGELQGLLEVEANAASAPALRAQEAALRGLAGQAATALRAARAGEERRALEHYLDRLIDGGSALVAAVDARFAISVFNGALESATSLRREDVLGKRLVDLLPASERPSAETALQAALLGAPDVTVEVHLASRLCLFSATGVLASDGHPEGVLLVGQDLTQLKQLEARALQAEKLATLGRLATDIAHEIVNPLTTVSMYAEHLRQRPQAESDAQKLQRIGESADRILRFARELLGYAKPSREPLEHVVLDEVVQQAARFCQEAIEGRKARLVLSLQHPPLAVRGHRQKLTQVLVNLLTNSAQAIPLGGHIEVRTELRDGAAQVTVRDDGPGMPPEVRARLFEPFFSTKPEGEGSGLGLSIVRGIVEAAGGSVSVESAPGRGTVFTVRLPAASATPATP